MSRENSRITLRDVARVAGVSVGTVSKYINSPSSVKKKGDEIAAAIDKLDFIPNAYAQKLAKGKSNAVVVYIVSERAISPTSWLHELPVIQSLHDCLQLAHYDIQIRITYAENPKGFSASLRQCIASKAVDGVAIVSVWEMPDDIIELLAENHFPSVLLGTRDENARVSSVYINNKCMVEELVDLLYGLSHRRIGFIHVKDRQQDMRFRYEGYRRGIEKYNLKFFEEDVLFGDFSIESAYQSVKKLLKKGTDLTALICGNDNMAVGALNAMREVGLEVPGDMSIIGIDNSIAARACVPCLTTVEFEMKKMGEIASQNLLEQMNASDSSPICVEIPYRMITGKSVAKSKKT